MDVSELLERAAEWAATKVKAVTADQLGKGTPCDEWDVRALTNHMTSGVKMVGRAARGEEPDPQAFGGEHVGDHPGAAYSSALESTRAALEEPGVMDRTWRLPFGERPAQAALPIFGVDQITHGWDLAKATGQDTTIPPDLAAAAMGIVGGRITDRGPGKLFKEEVPVPDDASDQDKLLGYLGRTP